MTKLEQLLDTYRNANIDAYCNGNESGTGKLLADAEEALKQHIEGAMVAAMVHGKETERAVEQGLAWEQSRADAWDNLVGEWVGDD